MAETLWRSSFMKKTKAQKLFLVRRPWHFPMASQNLAAVDIQRTVRGHLCRRGVAPISRSSKQRASDPASRGGYRSHAAFTVYHIAAMQIQYVWRAHCQRKMWDLSKPTPQVLAAIRIERAWRRYTNMRIYRYYRDLIMFRSAGNPGLMLKCINPREAHIADAAAGIHVRFRLGGSVFPPNIYYKIYTHQPLCDVNAFAPKDYVRARQCTTRKAGPGATKPAPGRLGAGACDSRGNSTVMALRVGSSVFNARMSHETRDGSGRAGFSGWYVREDTNGWRPVTLSALNDARNNLDQHTTASASHLYAAKFRRRTNKAIPPLPPQPIPASFASLELLRIFETNYPA